VRRALRGSTPSEREARDSGEIHLRIPTLGQLFDPMDPSPATRKDLHPHVEQFIVSWGREITGKARIALVIHVDDPPPDPDLRSAAQGIQAYFEERTQVERRRLRHLFRIGRISLVIAVVVLGLSFAAGELLQATDSPLAKAIGGTLEIGGWVAMWRPLEIFLYEWWPIRGDIQLFRRLADMSLRVVSERSL